MAKTKSHQSAVTPFNSASIVHDNERERASERETHAAHEQREEMVQQIKL